MKISELKEFQKVKRPSRDQYGNRIYEEVEFEKLYDPSETSLNRRFFSKLMDIAFAIAVQISLSKIGLIETSSLWFDLGILLVLIILTSSLMEWTIGSSFGKLLFNLEVVNDYCKSLSLKRSMYKNIFSFGIIFVLFFSHVTVGFSGFYTKWLKKRSIYVIRRTERTVIKKMMQHKYNISEE